MADMPFKTIDLAKDRARLIAENKELRAKLSEARALAKNWKLVAHKKREEARRVFAKLSAREATIAKLPKTADGVPLVQPLELWVLDGYGRLQTGVYIGFEDREDGMLVLVFDAINEGHWAIPVAECFSTPAAAEAARDAEGKA